MKTNSNYSQILFVLFISLIFFCIGLALIFYVWILFFFALSILPYILIGVILLAVLNVVVKKTKQ